MPATVLDVSDYYVVLRPFSGLGRELQRGEVVPAVHWRNVQPLINTRYLAAPWSPEGRAALPEDHELNLELRLPDDDSEIAVEAVEPGDRALEAVAQRRPGRPRKETVDA